MELVMDNRKRIASAVLALAVGALACNIPGEVAEPLAGLSTLTPTTTSVPTATLYVAMTGDDANACTSLSAPCRTINIAVSKAPAGALILIGPGTYAEEDIGHEIEGHVFTRFPGAALVIDRNVTLRGEVASGPPTTIITGADLRTPVSFLGSVQVVIENVEITHGGQTLGAGGGGFGLSVVTDEHSNVTLRNSWVRNNLRVGVWVLGNGTVILENVQITGNGAGGVDAGGTVIIRASRILDNAGEGSAVSNEGTMYIYDTTISGNRLSGDEFGVENGAGADLRIERSTISGNRSTGVDNHGNLVMINSTISGNVGDGIWSGGESSLLSLVFSTVAQNGGYGLYLSGPGSPGMRIDSDYNVIENNGLQDCFFSNLFAITVNLRGPTLSDGSCAAAAEGAGYFPAADDPFLTPLADNGGPTQTHALLEGSPAIDAAGDACIGTDQRGIARPVGGGCDIGAFERAFDFGLPPTAAPAILPTSTDIPTATPLAAAPVADFIKNAFCRKGPAVNYNDVTGFSQGDSASVEGRNDDSSWWYVLHTDGQTRCWVSGTTVQLSGPVDNVPVVQPPALPEEVSEFVINSRVCTANGYTIKLAWTDVEGEDGYRMYRDGELVQDLKANATAYLENPPFGGPYTYGLEAFNENGTSLRLELTDEPCP
jgi:hypothetical protein